MKTECALEALLRSFQRYYDLKTDGVDEPFAAEAEFHAHSEQYLLVRAAHVADIDSNEYVFFAVTATLTADYAAELARAAWERGIARVRPYYGHRNSDVTLVVVADCIESSAVTRIQRLRYAKSYKCSLYGWSSFRILAYEAATGRAVYNRRGKDLRALVSGL